MIYRNSFFIAKYSYSPITQYHKIKPYLKVHYVFSLLFFTPYTNSDQIINFILITFLVIEISIFRKLLYSSKLDKIKFIVLTICYMTLMNQLTIHKNINSYNSNKKFFILKLTYFVKTSLVNLHKNTVNLKHYFILFTIPHYILRLISIYIMLSNGLNILYLCTKYESVLETAIFSLNIIKKNCKFTIKTT
uniref:Transmembrane protein n=1 Tax=Corynecladia elata TaxID=3101723 RepID=A0AA51NG82_9FLOR|nr:hypothetical protein RU988_pgp121 [Laurencia elata]WMP12673.1 hypothetical protein [Laurencia elata]